MSTWLTRSQQGGWGGPRRQQMFRCMWMRQRAIFHPKSLVISTSLSGRGWCEGVEVGWGERKHRGGGQDAERAAGSKWDAGGDEKGSLFVVQRTGEQIHYCTWKQSRSRWIPTQKTTAEYLQEFGIHVMVAQMFPINAALQNPTKANGTRAERLLLLPLLWSLSGQERIFQWVQKDASATKPMSRACASCAFLRARNRHFGPVSVDGVGTHT